MARNLLRAGHHVALWSHSAGKAVDLAKEGDGVACATPAEVGAQSDVIFLCVGDTEMSEKAILGGNGIIKGAKSGSTIEMPVPFPPASAGGSAKNFPNLE